MHATPEARPNWDMTPFFPAPEAPPYVAFRDAVAADLPRLRRRAEELGPIAAERRDGWVELLCALEDAHARFLHLSTYLGCLGAADARDELVRRETGRLATLEAELEKAFVAVRAAMKSATDGDFAALCADERLAPVRHFLRRVRTRAALTMAAPLEELAADLAVTGLSAWGRLYDRVSGTLTFELAVPGRDTKTLPVSMVRSLLEDEDAAVRKAALTGSAVAWDRAADAVAACLNGISGTRLTLYARRGIAHFLDPALFDAGIERGTLDAMLAAVRGRQEMVRRYLRRKARLLGRDRLGFQDLMAPLPRPGGGRVPWDAGTRRVVEAFGGAFPALRAFTERALAERWIDWEPRAGKRPGGFCSSSSVVEQSRIFMTYNGAAGEVSTLAHELGHAYHADVMRGMRPWAREYPMTLAETASTFAEQLVTDAALASPSTDDAERAAILDARLQDAEAFLLNIPMRFDFEHRLYEERAAGEIGVTRLKELMQEAQRKNYGDALADGELDPWFWASKLHFYITDVSFYNFPYTFGYLFSRGIFARAKAEGPSFMPRYEALLRATGSDTPENVAKQALGVDLGGAEFWNASIDHIEEDLRRFEAITDRR